ncbi:uncharacterized protein LOC128391697 [Panonychus citri]|uniref:uncharacterized protein LOC128391697 n=1 Tax=Panonychus citri TaxID=50023 RepID=UPI002307C957|nr:uncharacterized protein LOC128391697 [Panonychus citri]
MKINPENWRHIKLEHNNDLYLTDLTSKIDEMSISPNSTKNCSKTINKLKQIKQEKMVEYIGKERKQLFEGIFNRLPINSAKLDEYILSQADFFNFVRDERIEGNFDTVDIFRAYKFFIYRKARTKRNRRVAYQQKLDEEVKLIDDALCKRMPAMAGIQNSDFSPESADMSQRALCNRLKSI